MPLDMQALEANIFWPNVYHGSKDPQYHQKHDLLERSVVVGMVQRRAQLDGQYAIDNNLVGPSDAKMRVMMEFVSNPEMIAQALDHPSNVDETVDFICRDLANASKVVANK